MQRVARRGQVPCAATGRDRRPAARSACPKGGEVASTDASGDDLAPELDAMARDEGMTAAVCAERLDGSAIVALRRDEPFPPASTIKVPVMVEVFRQAQLGRLHLSDLVELGPEDQVTGSGVLQHMSPGIRLPVRDLVTLMIVVSDNAATNMLIDRVGVDAVNATMAALGLRRTILFNKLQVVPVDRRGANVSTAADMTLLLRRVARGEVVSYEACRRMVDVLLRQTLSGGLRRYLPVDALDHAPGAPARVRVASKGGTIEGHRHDVGLVLMDHGSYAISVYVRDVKDGERATDLIGRISRRVFEAAAAPQAGAAG